MLPAGRLGQNYVKISPIVGGKITLPERYFVQPFDGDARNTVPSLAFLIQRLDEAGTARHVLFDLGLRSTMAAYNATQQRHLKGREPHVPGPGVAETLRREGYKASGIGTVILSHVHYDHHGDPEHFPSAQFIVGPGTRRLLRDGLATSASHQSFDPELLPLDRLTELPEIGQDDDEGAAAGQWRRLGPFWSIDLFRDGSTYVLNSPGHLPGHINLLCRTGPDRWVCLCGDSYHDHRLLTGEREIGTWHGDNGEVCCIHVDRHAAAQSIVQLRELERSGNVELVGAHDSYWLDNNQSRLFPATM